MFNYFAFCLKSIVVIIRIEGIVLPGNVYFYASHMISSIYYQPFSYLFSPYSALSCQRSLHASFRVKNKSHTTKLHFKQFPKRPSISQATCMKRQRLSFLSFQLISNHLGLWILSLVDFQIVPISKRKMSRPVIRTRMNFMVALSESCWWNRIMWSVTIVVCSFSG